MSLFNFRLIKLNKRIDEHKANIIDDFDLLKEFALTNKKQNVLDNWLSDNIDNTVDYKAVTKRLKSFIGESEFQLVEALAEESVKIILEEFPVKHVKARFSKPGAVTGSKEVGVMIERHK